MVPASAGVPSSGSMRSTGRLCEFMPIVARTCEVTVLDIADCIASAKVVSQPFVDYLHLAKLDGRWSIVNVLYEDRQPASE
jgi:putative lumazine-binding protein